MLEKLFRSKAEVAVLNIVLFSDGLHLREIARRAGVSSYEAKRELDTLSEIGILESDRRGNQVIFNAHEGCTFLDDLRGIFRKTEGAMTKVKGGLADFPGITYCLVFGSAAKGRASERSDIDLLVIGDVDADDLDQEILILQKGIRREINHIHWSVKDFRKKLKAKSPFLKNISADFIWIGGDKDEFVRAVEEAYGRESGKGSKARG